MDILSPGQQSTLLALLRVLASAEDRAERLRCRLCETLDFDPYVTFKSLQSAWHNQKGWVSAVELRAWITSQPHYSSCVLVDDVISALSPFVNEVGELCYEGFLRMVLPKERCNATLKEMAMTRGSRLPYCSGEDRQPSLEVCRRLCAIVENEVELSRSLKVHQRTLRELGAYDSAVIRFLDSAQGVCAGMGGLIAPGAVREVLVHKAAALTPSQCEALLRRINPQNACLAAFSDLAKYLHYHPDAFSSLSPPSPSLTWRRSEGNLRMSSSIDLSVQGVHDLSRSLQASPPLSPRARSEFKSTYDFNSPPSVPKLGASFLSPITNNSFDAYRDSLEAYREELFSPRASLSDKAKRAMSPGRASTRASSTDLLSPASASSRRGTAGKRASSVPRIASPIASPSPLSPPEVPDLYGSRFMSASRHLSPSRSVSSLANSRFCFATYSPESEPLKAVLRTMLMQADADARVEDTKALMPSTCSLEAVFRTLDRHRKGYVVDSDLWQLAQDFGGQLPYSKLLALVHDLQLRECHDRVSLPGRLTMRDISRLVLRVGSKEAEAVRGARSDAEALSMLYLARNVDVGDRGAAAALDSQDPLPVTTKYHIYRLIEAAAREAADLEVERKLLFSRRDVDLGVMRDLFNYIADGRVSIKLGDLRRAFYDNTVLISEGELKLLWSRYAPYGTEITFIDFTRQLKPSSSVIW